MQKKAHTRQQKFSVILGVHFFNFLFCTKKGDYRSSFDWCSGRFFF